MSAARLPLHTTGKHWPCSGDEIPSERLDKNSGCKAGAERSHLLVSVVMEKGFSRHSLALSCHLG